MGPIRFTPGEIVHLNSGSPDLKVIAVDGDQVTVEWDGGKQQATFSDVCLQGKGAAYGTD